MGLYFFRSFIKDAALEERNGYLACSIHSTCQPAHTYSSKGDVMQPLFWALYNAKYNPVQFCTPTSGQHIARYRDNWIRIVDPVTGVHTQHAESNWSTAK